MRLYLALGPGAAASDLIRKYHTAKEVYAHLSDIEENGGQEAETARSLAAVTPARAEETLAVCREFNWQILTAENAFYPASLRAIRSFPVLLFAMGDLRLLSVPQKIAVVGTRNASDEGKGLAYGIGRELAKSGIVTVSGCARGIDHAAHAGALSCSGATIGVLGNGFGYNYMPEDVFFRRRIEKYGLLLSELAPFTAPSRATFPMRNRIIAGLCAATVVVQSGVKGGSLITADDCLKQKKPLFVPASALLPSEGTAALMKKGAAPLADLAPVMRLFERAAAVEEQETSPLEPYRDAPPAELFPERLSLEDFAFYSQTTPAEAAAVYQRFYASVGQREQKISRAASSQTKTAAPPRRATAGKPKEKKAVPAKAHPEAKTLTGDEKILYEALSAAPKTLDALVLQTALDIRAVMKAATRLELKGLAKTVPGNMLALS